MDEAGFTDNEKGTTAADARGTEASRRPCTILLAEDEPDIRYLVTLFLQGRGYEVVAVGDGEAAVQEFARREGAIDFLLFDLIMPHKNGWKAFWEISQVRPGIPHLFMSGFMGNVLQSAPLESGEDVIVMRKPFAFEELLARLESLLER